MSNEFVYSNKFYLGSVFFSISVVFLNGEEVVFG